MGCVASRKIDNEERVQRCRERRRLTKQLLLVRAQFAAAQMSYLHALKNTGVTLRQFAESESSQLDLDDVIINTPPSSSSSLHHHHHRSSTTTSALSSPPPPPPPPPPFSPIRTTQQQQQLQGSSACINDEIPDEEEDDDVSSTYTPPPPPPPPLPSSSSWNLSSWDPFDPFSSTSAAQKQQVVEEDEEWAETNTEFQDENEEEQDPHEEVVEEVVNDVVVALDLLPMKHALMIEFNDDNSSVASSWCTKETAADDDVPMLVHRRKNTLTAIVKEIDDYFLKAYDSGREVAILLDINRGDSLHHNFDDSTRKSFKSAKVFSALSWSWSSKSLQSSKDAVECHESNEPCKPIAHSITLDKLNIEEERLYKEVKEEEIAKLEYDRKTLLLLKQEAGEQDSIKTEEARTSIESLESHIICLQQSISNTCLSILKLRDEELHPQLLELSSRLTRMWRTMYECHQVQNHISQQVNHLTNHPSKEPTSDYHRQSTLQLQTEVNAWYNSFCHLLKSQREYVRVLNRWVHLAESLVDNHQQSDHPSDIYILCEEWQLALERLPEKVAAEAIKSFISIIHSIVLQQTEERILHKKSDRLERRLQKELDVLSEMEKKFDGNSTVGEITNLSPNHPLVAKRARTEVFKKKVEDEKAKYLQSVQVSRAMTLNNLQTSLPNVFQALTGFSSVCAQTFEAIHGVTHSIDSLS